MLRNTFLVESVHDGRHGLGCLLRDQATCLYHTKTRFAACLVVFLLLYMGTKSGQPLFFSRDKGGRNGGSDRNIVNEF